MKPVLGVGWDVGGWIGRKQGVAVATIGSSGVEWLGAGKTFSLADLGSADWTLLQLVRQAWPDAPDDTLDRYRIVLAIDAPLGFPVAFAQMLQTGKAPSFAVAGREIDNPLAYRECDRHIYTTFNKKPLSASFDKLGNNATVAMHHARRLARLHDARMPPFDTADDRLHTIIEVYPALSKVPKNTCCFPSIQRLLPPQSVAGTDECDACICAVMALAFVAGGSCAGIPPLAELPIAKRTARTEGWIYYVPPTALTQLEQR